jgi:hypothetical protein
MCSTKETCKKLWSRLQAQGLRKDVAKAIIVLVFDTCDKQLRPTVKEIVRIVKSVKQANNENIPFATSGSAKERAASIIQLTKTRAKQAQKGRLHADIAKVKDEQTALQKHHFMLSLESGNQSGGGFSQSQK